ncbi:MAG TPA: hypothetical protein VIW26_14700 [Gemmatimonadales bacterium]|jgi:hypothetical protein
MRSWRKYRWVPFTPLCLVVMLCQKKADQTPTVPKNQPGHIHRSSPGSHHRNGTGATG